MIRSRPLAVKPVLRVVSLVPSLTETVLAMGITPIACTRFCEQPSLAHVGGTKNPDIAAIVALQPDLVLMDREENRREDADALTAAGIDVFATHVVSIADIAPMLTQLCDRLGHDPAPVTGRPDTSPNPAPLPAPPPAPLSRNAFVAIWRRPWMTVSAATYGSSLLASIGILNVFADHPSTYPTVTLEQVAARNPQMVLLPSEPYPFKQRHVDEITAALPGIEIRLIDGQDLFWWGARTGAAADRLAQVLGPSSP